MVPSNQPGHQLAGYFFLKKTKFFLCNLNYSFDICFSNILIMQNEQINQLTEIGKVYDITYSDGTVFQMKRVGTDDDNEATFVTLEGQDEPCALYNDFDMEVVEIVPVVVKPIPFNSCKTVDQLMQSYAMQAGALITMGEDQLTMVQKGQLLAELSERYSTRLKQIK